MQISTIQNDKLIQSNKYHTPTFAAKPNFQITEVAENTPQKAIPAELLAKYYNVPKATKRRNKLVTEARAQLLEDKLPQNFYQRADEIMEKLNLQKDQYSSVINMLVEKIGPRTLDCEIMKKNITNSAKHFGIDESEFIKMALKQPTLFCSTTETIKNNISESAKQFGICEQELIKTALKVPSLFNRAPETLKSNISGSAKILGIEEDILVKAALKNPFLFFTKPEMIQKNIEENARQFGIKTSEFIKLSLKAAPLFTQSPKTLKKNIERNAKQLNIEEKEFLKAALKHPTLFTIKAETLKKNIEKSSKLLMLDENTFIKNALNTPTLFLMKPETIKEHVEKNLEQFGVSESTFVKSAIKNPALFVVNPETLITHAKELQFAKEVKKGIKTDELFKCINPNSTKYTFADLLKYLVLKFDGEKLPKGNPITLLSEYLKNNSSKLYKFELPNHECTQKLIDFAQEFSMSVLNKNIFKFVIS